MRTSTRKSKENIEISTITVESPLKIWHSILERKSYQKEASIMAIIPQINMFDYSDIENLGDLERLELAFSGIDDEGVV